jgi:hypothetical protein
MRAGVPKVCTETFPGMGDLSRKGLHSQIAFTPGAEDKVDATLAPMLPSSPPPDSVNLLTFLPREKGGKLGKSMPHAASWPAALTALPLVGAERLLTEPAVAANRSLPDGAFPTLGAEGHDADRGRAPTHLSGGRASKASFLPPVRSRVRAAPVLCVLAVLTA